MKDKLEYRLKLYFTIFTVLMASGVAGFVFIEKMSFTDAVYFSIVTMATVGYGDIHPLTEIGKILTLFIIVGGVGTFLGVIASITDLFVNRREETSRHKKVNMVTGLFFSEMGNSLLEHLVRLDPEIGSMQGVLTISPDWIDDDYEQANLRLENLSFSISTRDDEFHQLFTYLQDHADLLMRLLENPTIQDHEHFTELLQALFHLRDELLHRDDLVALINSDRKHLEGDIARVYRLLVFEWLRYVQYLQKEYNYLFSLAVRINPFNPESSAVVRP